MTDEKKKTITIDNKQYDYDSLSDIAKGQISNLQVTDAEISMLQTRLNITQTARSVYINALKAELEK